MHLRHVPHPLAASFDPCTPSRSRRSATSSWRSWRSASPLTVYLILKRLDYLKSEAQLESVLSRESSFLFNNLILLASCFAVLWGTLFPVITEAVIGEKISGRRAVLQQGQHPDRPVPAVADRSRPAHRLAPQFVGEPEARLPLADGRHRAHASLACLAAVGIRHIYALMSFGLCAFVTVTIVMEF